MIEKQLNDTSELKSESSVDSQREQRTEGFTGAFGKFMSKISGPLHLLRRTSTLNQGPAVEKPSDTPTTRASLKRSKTSADDQTQVGADDQHTSYQESSEEEYMSMMELDSKLLGR